METWDAIRSRRNVRIYEDRTISEDDLERILEAGRRTPSSKNEQRWDFIVIRDRQRLGKLSQAQQVAGSTATIALVGPDPVDPSVRESIAYDMGQVTMSIIIAATDLGIGSSHSSARNIDLSRELLELPPDRRVWWLIGLGYPADRPLKPIGNPRRRPLSDVVHNETW